MTTEQTKAEPATVTPIKDQGQLVEAGVTPEPMPVQMLMTALEKGQPVEIIEKLMALEERWHANQGRRAFDRAIAKAKAEFPPLIKTGQAEFAHKSGSGKTAYAHDDLAALLQIIEPILARHGLSVRWRARQEGNRISVTMVLAHEEGHYEETTLEGPDDTTGSKNPLQAKGSTCTYLQRYTLKLGVGLAAAKDRDGHTGEKVPDDKIAGNVPITHQQVKELEDLAKTTGADVDKFCIVQNIEGLEQITLNQLPAAKELLIEVGRKRAQRNRKAVSA